MNAGDANADAATPNLIERLHTIRVVSCADQVLRKVVKLNSGMVSREAAETSSISA
jgi:hypothetical protein